MSTGLATLHELGSVYGIKDVYDLLEIAAVDAHNRRTLHRRAVERAKAEAAGR